MRTSTSSGGWTRPDGGAATSPPSASNTPLARRSAVDCANRSATGRHPRTPRRSPPEGTGNRSDPTVGRQRCGRSSRSVTRSRRWGSHSGVQQPWPRSSPTSPPSKSVALAMRGHLAAGEQLAVAIRRAWWPIVAVLAVRSRRARWIGCTAVLAAPRKALIDARVRLGGVEHTATSSHVATDPSAVDGLARPPVIAAAGDRGRRRNRLTDLISQRRTRS